MQLTNTTYHREVARVHRKGSRWHDSLSSAASFLITRKTRGIFDAALLALLRRTQFLIILTAAVQPKTGGVKMRAPRPSLSQWQREKKRSPLDRRGTPIDARDTVPPAAVLWPDKKREWEQLVPRLRLGTAALLDLRRSVIPPIVPAPRSGCGAYWPGKIADVSLPTGTVPIIDIPRHLLLPLVVKPGRSSLGVPGQVLHILPRAVILPPSAAVYKRWKS